MKEDVCFVSMSFQSDLRNCFNLKGEMTVSKQYTHRDCEIQEAQYSNNRTSSSDRYIQKDGNDENKEENEEMKIVNNENNQNNEKNTNNENDEDEEDVEYLRKFFIMPDFNRIMKGYVKKEGEAFAADEQVTYILFP